VLGIVVVGSIGLMLRSGVSVGNRRIHWHPVDGFYVGELKVRGGWNVGKAFALGPGAICIYRQLAPETGADMMNSSSRSPQTCSAKCRPPEGKRRAGWRLSQSRDLIQSCTS
jgi:hypothetical protein